MIDDVLYLLTKSGMNNGDHRKWIVKMSL